MGLADIIYNYLRDSKIWGDDFNMEYTVKTRSRGVVVEIRPYNHERDFSGLAVFEYNKAVKGGYSFIREFTPLECELGVDDEWLDVVCGDGRTRRDKTCQLYFCDTTLGRFAYQLGVDHDFNSVGRTDLICVDDILIYHVTDISGYKHIYVCHKDKSVELTRYINDMYSYVSCDFKIF